MPSTLSTAIDALGIVFSWPNILYPIGGTLVAMVASILPGISGVALMAVVIPLTFFWPPLEIALLFGALVGGATFMGSITAILLNVPGRTSNAATAIDGYPLSQQGKAKTAIAASATASALGSTFGIGILVVLIPFMIPIARAFGPFDMLMAIICGLSTIAFVVRGSWLKGLIMAGFGLTLSFTGVDQQTAEFRFTFNSLYLQDGLSPILLFLGVFAVAEMIELALSRNNTISGRTEAIRLTGSISQGIKSVFTHYGLFLRCSTIGTVIGMMPGVGSVVASWVAYGHATQSAGGGDSFGKGDIRGVIAPEAANDAKDGGALIPTLAIGLPGGLGTAMLLAAFTMHGINPGPELLSSNLGLVFVLIWSLFLSNWLTSILGLGGISWFARITTIPNGYLVPIVLAIVTLSAYTFRGYNLDVLVVFTAGVFGYYLKKFDWPRVPFVIALILGPYFENLFHVSRQLYQLDRIDIASSPIAMAFIVLTLAGFIALFFRKRPRSGTVETKNHSTSFSLLLTAFIIATLIQTLPLSQVAKMVPVIVLTISIVLLCAHLVLSNYSARARGDRIASESIGIQSHECGIVICLFLLGPMTVFVGPQIAVPLFVFLYLLFQTRPEKTRLLTITGLIAGLIGLFTQFGLNRAFDGGMMQQLLIGS